MSPEQALANVYDVKNYTYSVVYYFDVPKDGTVKQTAVMTVIVKETEKETQKETETESQTESVSESQTETRKLSVAAKKQETTEETVINNK